MELVNDTIADFLKKLSALYLKTSNKLYLKETENTLSEYVKSHPDDEYYIRLASAIFIQVEGREDEALEWLQKIPSNSPWHYKSVLIETYVRLELTGTNKETYDRLLSLHSPDNEFESMKYYMAANHFLNGPQFDYQALLKKSVDLCKKHVWNLVSLGRTYQSTNNNLARTLWCDALDNVEFVGFSYKRDEEITDIDFFIKANIKGIYLTTSHLHFIANDLRPIPREIYNPWDPNNISH